MTLESLSGRKDNISAPEDKLRLFRSKLQALMKLSNDFIAILDRNGIIVDLSENAAVLLETDVNDVIGKFHWEDFLPEEEKPRLAGYFFSRANGTGDPPSSYTLRLKLPSGERFMRAKVDFIPGTEDRIVVLKDLSEVVEEKRRTAESEERYRAVVENTNDGILICTMERTLFANTSFCNMTGLPREEVYMLSPMRLFHDSDRNKLEELFPVVGDRAGHRGVFEVRVRKRSGFLPAELSSVAINYRNTEAVLFSVRDLTRRKEAEKKLKEQHELLQAIVDNSPVGISVYDSKGTLLMFNSSWATIWGKTPEQIEELKVPKKELRIDDSDSYLGDYLEQVVKVYREGGYLYIPILKTDNFLSGAAEYISHHFYALKNEDGTVDKVIVLTLDLTETLKVKDELKETRDRYDQLFSEVPVALYRTTLDPDSKIISANPKMKKLFFDPENPGEIDGVRVSDLYRNPQKRREFLKKLEREKEIQGFEIEFRRMDGSTFLGSVSARMVKGRNGGQDYIEGMILDVTEQKKREEELLKIEQLETIGTLAGGIAHDFNNLLMAIQGSIFLAMEERDPEKIRRRLEEAESAVEEAAVLTGRLLTFTRGGAPMRKLVDVESCVREPILFCLSGSLVKAEFRFDDNLFPIYADQEQVSQAVRNIALNAVQAMPDGGRITVTCGNVILEKGNIRALNPGEYVKISIRDEGPGIPPDDMRKVFNPYFTTKPDGTGLGLATSFSIIKKHSGAISVSSVEGEGAEFTIYLPAETGAVAGEEDEKKWPRGGEVGALSILIMDDDDKVRKVLKEMLLSLGHDVEESRNGNEVVEIYGKRLEEGRPFDLVILDLTVSGGIGGEAAVASLKEMDPDVKAIVCSGYTNNPVLADHKEYGFSGSLVKPFSFSALEEEIRSVMGAAGLFERG